MNIGMNYTNPQFLGLVPLKRYKGLRLQLTEEDNERIKILQDEISQAEISLYKLRQKYDGKYLRTEQMNAIFGIEDKLTMQITALQEMIRDIKIKRFNIQKLKKN